MTVSPETFRRTLSNLAGGVTVVTARSPEGTLSGLTATSVCSVSLEPPLVLVCIERDTRTHAVVGAAGAFAVNLLTGEQSDLARHFATDLDEKFVGIPHGAGRTGAPLLETALGYCECTVVRTVPAGDHTIYVGEVQAAGVDRGAEKDALVYLRGAYRAMGGADRVRGAAPDAEADRERAAGDDD